MARHLYILVGQAVWPAQGRRNRLPHGWDGQD
jgi:hypothetical protein